LGSGPRPVDTENGGKRKRQWKKPKGKKGEGRNKRKAYRQWAPLKEKWNKNISGMEDRVLSRRIWLKKGGERKGKGEGE